MRIHLNNRQELGRVNLKIQDGNYGPVLPLMKDIVIEMPYDQYIDIDENIINQIINNLSSYQIENLFSKLDDETLQRFADKIYKAKFEDIVNK